MSGPFEKGLASLPAIFDAYGRQARLYPALLVVLPIFLFIVACFPDLITSTSAAALLTIAGSCGLLYAASSLARSQGKRVEKRILERNGGWPTTILLRHSSRLDDNSRKRYHEYLSNNISGLIFPTKEMEAENQASADNVYVSAIKWLKEKTRGKAFPLVESENAQYGFRRNLAGLKHIAIIVHFFVIFCGSATLGYVLYVGGPSAFGEYKLLAVVVLLTMLSILFWTIVVNDDWVWEAGEQYAEALLATCDQLNTAASPPKKRASPRVRSVGSE